MEHLQISYRRGDKGNLNTVKNIKPTFVDHTTNLEFF